MEAWGLAQLVGREFWPGEGRLGLSRLRSAPASHLGQHSGQEAGSSRVLVLSELLPDFRTLSPSATSVLMFSPGKNGDRTASASQVAVRSGQVNAPGATVAVPSVPGQDVGFHPCHRAATRDRGSAAPSLCRAADVWGLCVCSQEPTRVLTGMGGAATCASSRPAPPSAAAPSAWSC